MFVFSHGRSACTIHACLVRSCIQTLISLRDCQEKDDNRIIFLSIFLFFLCFCSFSLCFVFFLKKQFSFEFFSLFFFSLFVSVFVLFFFGLSFFFFFFLFFFSFSFLLLFSFKSKINMLNFLTMPMVKGGSTRDAFTQTVALTGGVPFWWLLIGTPSAKRHTKASKEKTEEKCMLTKR